LSSFSNNKTQQRDFAYRALRQLLILQQINEKERLREPEWAERLDVNRAALREAFARLEAEGLIEKGPKTGYFVPTLSDQDIREILHVRSLLECAAIEIICADKSRRQSAAQPLGAICDEMAEMIKKDYLLGVGEADRRFHERLIEHAGSKRLALIYNRAPLPMIHRRVVEAGLWAQESRITLDEHRAILKQVASGNAEEAQAIMRVHLRDRYMLPLIA
jgi:DNA-binding GntR family transcriptional regulator